MALPIDGRETRVLRPGGIVAAYAWNMAGGGFPYSALLDELRALDVAVAHPPSEVASRTEVMRELWSGAGLDAVETRVISAQRTFVDFEDCWATILGSTSAGRPLAAMPPDALARLRARLEARLSLGRDGAITSTTPRSGQAGPINV